MAAYVLVGEKLNGIQYNHRNRKLLTARNTAMAANGAELPQNDTHPGIEESIDPDIMGFNNFTALMLVA
jgi:hypothetical protein